MLDILHSRPATIASLGMFLSKTSARLRRIPAESIAPTERRMPRKNRTPRAGQNKTKQHETILSEMTYNKREELGK